MTIEHTNWDNLRLFLAVVRARSAQEAARRLEVDHSTITRRLRRLEQELGAQLFERTPAGHALTTAGHRLLERVEQMENSMVLVGEEIGGERHALTGHVRLGATEGFGSFFLARHLARFAECHPGIQVDLLIVPRFINLSQREADLAVNVERPQSSGQVCSRLCDYRLQLYASSDYLARHPPITHVRHLRGHRFVGYVEELVFSNELRELAALVPQTQTLLRSTSVVAQYQAARGGHGLALLPCFMAAHDDGLVPVLPGAIGVQRTFWIAASADRRDLARVRALWDFLRETVAREEALLGGRAPGPAQSPDLAPGGPGAATSVDNTGFS
ncbi:LysR family transcriptional regulator [Melaminivora sp.]|uniref:LysR family transcriptional regulator n=1 Tax=Melaminivora sp. TaxID=1933032 RepID=UPI0028B0B6B6|nr:LysR family transcriptional regulator [Melaminivora sp.]